MVAGCPFPNSIALRIAHVVGGRMWRRHRANCPWSRRAPLGRDWSALLWGPPASGQPSPSCSAAAHRRTPHREADGQIAAGPDYVPAMKSLLSQAYVTVPDGGMLSCSAVGMPSPEMAREVLVLGGEMTGVRRFCSHRSIL